MPNRCTLHKLSLKDPAAAAADPALAALLRDGWTVISDVPVANHDDPHLMLFLAPPRPTEGSRLSMALSALGIVLGALSCGMWIASVVFG